MINRWKVVPGISDHDIPLLDISSRVIINKKKPRKVFQYNKANFEELTNFLSNFSKSFCEQFEKESLPDTNIMWTKFKNAVVEAMDTYIPSKTVTTRKQSLPWVTSKIKAAIKKRNRMFKRARSTGSAKDQEAYLTQRAAVQAMIRRSYWNHIEHQIVGEDGEPTANIQKNFWSHVKATKKDRVGTAPLKDNGVLISDAQGKANILNRQYQSVFSKEDTTKIPNPIEEPSPDMPEIKVTRNGVLKLLRDLKENKASGPDNIPPRVLKAAADPISSCLQVLFNASLATGRVPDYWKLANITPVFKKGERFKACNYRPVSLTCICSKMMEHIVVSQMMDHFDHHNILTDCQHGFRERRSCETQLINLTQELHQSLEDQEQVDMVVLDFSKAFDKVPHQRLMKKLWNYGVRGSTHQWIQSFLIGRQQRVIVEGELSDWVPVESGVPQGTVLGPVLFLAYINDLPKSVTSNVRLFADDCVVYRTVSSTDDCLQLQDDLESLEEWEKLWCMSFNPIKCNTISITRKRKKIKYQYSLHSKILEDVDSATYLGVELSDDLAWTKHINKTTKKANKKLAFIKRNIQIKNTQVKETAYKGLVRPNLEYCATIWDPHQKKYIKQLEMVQRRAARYVTGRFHNTSSVTEMLSNLKWEPLGVRRQKARLAMLLKIQLSLVAVTLPALMVRPPRPRPGYPHHYLIPSCRTDAFKNSFFPRTITQWNALPPTIACQASLDSFKTAMATHSF